MGQKIRNEEPRSSKPAGTAGATAGASGAGLCRFGAWCGGARITVQSLLAQRMRERW